MITINNKKFAANEEEFTNSLFEEGGTCVGYYKVVGRKVWLLNAQKEQIGIIVIPKDSHNPIIAKVSKITENGKEKNWFNYGDIELLGKIEKVGDFWREIEIVYSGLFLAEVI